MSPKTPCVGNFLEGGGVSAGCFSKENDKKDHKLVMKSLCGKIREENFDSWCNSFNNG